jgi:hypothetical protein
LGQPRDVADVCLFLASPLAACVTGVVLPADGGWSLGGASTAMAAIAAQFANDVGRQFPLSSAWTRRGHTSQERVLADHPGELPT